MYFLTGNPPVLGLGKPPRQCSELAALRRLVETSGKSLNATMALKTGPTGPRVKALNPASYFFTEMTNHIHSTGIFKKPMEVDAESDIAKDPTNTAKVV
jgi:hypothetical protein